jgi:hypothetical protein
MILLESEYRDKLECDVLDMVDVRIGSLFHNALEQVNLKGELREQRLRYKICGIEITGKFDLMLLKSNNKYHLIDFKTAKTYKWVMNDFTDYIKQLSIYRWLADKNGLNVEQNAELGFWFKDWDRKKASWKKYPNYPLARKRIKLLSLNETEKFIKDKLSNIYESIKDNELPRCSNNELWIDKKGNWRRCDYCLVRKYCDQYKEKQKVENG